MNQAVSQIYDVIIIGAGPAGFTAGIYAARSDLNALLLEGTSTLSQITYTDHVENYPGFPEGISGYELNDRFRNQAVHLGLKTAYGDVAEIIKTAVGAAPAWTVKTNDATYTALACIIATGASWKKMRIPGEETLVGKGVSYCATCDGPFYRDKDLVVVGGGDTAVGEAIYLTRFARKVTVIHRRDRLRACGLLQKRAFDNNKIEFIWDAVPVEIIGEDHVTAIRLNRLKKSDEPGIIPTNGVFILIGLSPNTRFVRGSTNMDENGYIIIDEKMATSTTGIFACGDCVHKDLRQVVTACADGAVAAFSVQAYIEALKGM